MVSLMVILVLLLGTALVVALVSVLCLGRNRSQKQTQYGCSNDCSYFHKWESPSVDPSFA